MDSSYKPSLSLRDISPGGRDKRLARKIYDPASLCLVSIYNELSNCYNEGIEKYLTKWGIEMDAETVRQAFSDAANVVGVLGGAGAVIGVGKQAFKTFKRRKEQTDIDRYYNYVMDEFDRKEDSQLVGKEALSDKNVYIEAYSEEHSDEKILDSIEQWSHEESSGVILIHGEPGHGKTTLCRKAVYEHELKQFCPDKTNVFWFRLNPAYCDIITDGKLVLEDAFCWGNIKSQRKMIPLNEYENEYRNSVIFLDGYDELKVQAQSINIRLSDFIEIAKEYAEEYQMHLVITARTRSVEDELGGLNISTLQFAPMTEQQQRKWIHARTELQSYEQTFEKLRNSSNEMKELLGIPILFRMVVQAQLNNTANGIVELYDGLFETTMQRRKMNSIDRDNWHERYEQLAYEIYCNDETFADMRNEELPEDFLYMFHLKGDGEQHVEFLHRSFYQYFLAYFLYHKMAAVKDETSAEDFLCCLAERRIDRDILEYIRQIQASRQGITEEICEQIVDVLEQTDAIIPEELERKNKHGNAEKSRLSRCNNMFVNALSICYIVAAAKKNQFVISLQKRKSICWSMARYNCTSIVLKSADLSDADLSNAHLNCADLSNANLDGVNLFDANLSSANLNSTNLHSAVLNRTNLLGADLHNTNLLDADLRWTKNLDTCDFSDVKDWNVCKISICDKDSLGLDNPDAHGIIWCDDSGNPIPPSPLSND